MKSSTIAKTVLVGLVVLTAALFLVPASHAQEEGHGDAAEAASGATGGNGLRVIGLGIGAGLAVGLAGIGTGLAQAGVGAGGTGAIAEKPELLANVLILFAIPETIVLFGFVIAILLFTNI